jgi:hypothetical protein
MEKNQNSGISIKSVQLVQCNVGEVKAEADLKYSLGITGFGKKIVSDGKILLVQVSFDLVDGIKNPALRFECTFVATYARGEESPMKWEDFHDHVAIAHLIPYLREFVSNITTRLPLPVLMIPPVNTRILIEEYRKKLAKSEQNVQNSQQDNGSKVDPILPAEPK